MSGIINTLATLAAVGITGYFIYKVVLPGLGNIPKFEFPGLPTPQQPQQPQQPPSQGQQQEDDDEGDESAPSTTAPSAIAPPSAKGNIIYDSTKGWSGVKTAASGNPKWATGAGGVGTLSCGAGHCRIYISVPNHNAMMEGEFMFTGSVENISLRLRSRHNEGGACTNRFGGFGVAAYPSGERKLQTESCHNNHENTIKGKGIPLKPGTWYKMAYSCYDSPDKKSVNFKLDVNGKTEITGKHSSPKPYYMDENLHKQKSYIWIRSNNNGSGTVSIRNFRVVSLGTASTAKSSASLGLAMARNSMINEPYLYNGYYGRRRL